MFSLWSALLHPATQTGFLASSQQRRAAKTNKYRLRDHMNSTILCWPTLAPLFQAMNRAVWKKKIHTRSKSSKICLFVMVSRLGEKVILHLVLFYIFFHKQKALSGKGRTLLQKKKKLKSYRSRCRWEHQEWPRSWPAFIHDNTRQQRGMGPRADLGSLGCFPTTVFIYSRQAGFACIFPDDRGQVKHTAVTPVESQALISR